MSLNTYDPKPLIETRATISSGLQTRVRKEFSKNEPIAHSSRQAAVLVPPINPLGHSQKKTPVVIASKNTNGVTER